MRISIDDSLCTGCGLCRRACAAALGAPGGVYVSPVGDRFQVAVCRHCGRANCLAVCPVGAIVRVGESVLLDRERCIRCGLCVLACPFGLVEQDEHGVPGKCNGCPAERAPACVAACPGGVFTIGGSDE